MTESMIAVDGGEVWADDSGGDGRPLVLLHPGVGDSRIWAPILPALTPKYRVIRYDDRGFGHSPAPRVKYSLLSDLVAVLDHYGLDQVALVGCSQGGGSSLGLALAQPSRVAAIALLCPGVPGFPYPEEPEIEAAYGAATTVDEVAAVMLGIWGRSGATPEAMEQFRSAARAAIDGEGMATDDPPVFERLGEITVPTSLLVGDADNPALIESNKQAATRIPGCEFSLVPGMDHLPPLREPDLVIHTITATLARAAW
jgi:3-oxoadipate enol-lactonase